MTESLESTEQARLLPDIGRELARVGDFKRAEGVFGQVIDLTSQIEQPKKRARVLEDLLHDVGQLDISEPEARRGVVGLVGRVERMTESLESTEQARLLPDIGRELARVGDFKRAEGVFGQAMDLTSQIEQPKKRARAMEKYVDSVGRLSAVQSVNKRWTARLLRQGAQPLCLDKSPSRPQEESEGYLPWLGERE
jgi:hypothetical protein